MWAWGWHWPANTTPTFAPRLTTTSPRLPAHAPRALPPRSFEDTGHSKSARDMLKKYLKGRLPDGVGVRTGGGNGGAATKGGNAAEHGGNPLFYLLPVVVLAAALWWQFVRKADGAAH
jgi:hypothetical protein